MSHAGRRTNLDRLSVLQGAGKRNRSLELDGRGLHLLEDTVAHSKGKNLLPIKEKSVIYCGKDTTIEELKRGISEGHELGRRKFSMQTCFSSHIDTDDIEEDYSDLDEDSSDEDDDDLETVDIDATDDSRLEFSRGRRYHLATAVEKFCNQGRSSMAAQTRVRRIQIMKPSSLSLVGVCKTQSNLCKVMKIGEE